MKKRRDEKLILIIIMIMLCFSFQTVGFSAFSSTLNVNGDAYARVDVDVRITDFDVYEVSSGSLSNYVEYNKDSILTGITFPNSDSYIIYRVEITNYADEAGIYNISGLPTNLTYEFIDYKLKDRLCNSSNECSFGITKDIYIKIKYNSYNSNVTNYDINLNFEFRNVYSVTYTGIDNTSNYASSIMHGENLNITFSDISNKLNVFVDGIEIDRGSYPYDNTTGVFSYQNVNGDMVISKGESILLAGDVFNANIKNLVNGTTDATHRTEDSIVTYMGFYEDVIPDGHTLESLTVLPSVSVSENERVKSYNDNGKIYIYSKDDIVANESMYSMFRAFHSLTDLDMSRLDATNITSLRCLFYDSHNLINFDISNLNTNGVTDMAYMFYNLNKITKLDVSRFNTVNVTDMSYMFSNLSKVSSLDVSKFNTINVTNMAHMFSECYKLEHIYVGDRWTTENVTSSSIMFRSSSLLPNYDANYVDKTKAYAGGDGLGYLSRIITFTINDTEYTALDGMTYGEWVYSSYGSFGYQSTNSTSCTYFMGAGGLFKRNGEYVMCSDIINDGDELVSNSSGFQGQ